MTISSKTLEDLKIPLPKSKDKIQYWVDKISKPYDEKNTKTEKIKELEVLVRNRINDIINNEDNDEVELGDICNIKAAMGGKCLQQYYTNNTSDYGFITGKNLNNNNMMTYINKEGYKICKNYTVKKGDILIPEVYNLNSKCIIIKNEWSNYVFKGAFRIFDIKISNKYLCNYMNSQEFKDNLHNLTVGSIFKHASVKILKSIKIKIPKNKKLMKDLEPNFEKIENLQEEVKNAGNLYEQYIKDLSEEAIPQNKQLENKLIEESDNEEVIEHIKSFESKALETTDKKNRPNKKSKTKTMNANI